jgi:hypothetical protein
MKIEKRDGKIYVLGTPMRHLDHDDPVLTDWQRTALIANGFRRIDDVTFVQPADITADLALYVAQEIQRGLAWLACSTVVVEFAATRWRAAAMHECSLEEAKEVVLEALVNLDEAAGDLRGIPRIPHPFATIGSDSVGALVFRAQRLITDWWATLSPRTDGDEDLYDGPYLYFIGSEDGHVILDAFCLPDCWQGASHSSWPYRAAISPPLPPEED